MVFESLILGFVSSYAATLFGPIANRKLRTWLLSRVAEAAKASLQSLFQAERVTDESAKLVIDELKATFAACPLTAEMLVKGHYEADRIAEGLRQRYATSDDLRTSGLDDLYRKALAVAVERAIEVAHELPESDRLRWKELYGILSRPDQDDSAFEKTYRRCIAQHHARITLVGVPVPEVVDFELETAFVELGIGRLATREIPEAEVTVELRRLEDPRDHLLRELLSAGEPIRSLGEVLAENRRVVIVGAPGSGKTTLMKHLAWRAAREELRKLDEGLTDNLLPIPFLVRSLDFGKLPRPEGFVACCADMLASSCPPRFVERRLEAGQALVLVDGLDECDAEQHGRLMKWVRDMTEAHGDCAFVLTSRPAGYRAGELASYHYLEAELQPLTEDQVSTFVHGWYRAAEKAARSPDAERKAENSARDLLGRLGPGEPAREMGTNPLMLSVICVVHRYRHQSLPERRAQLLKECADVLLHEWHKARNLPESILGDLDLSEKTALVRPVAWEMMERGLAEAPRTMVEKAFGEVLPSIRQPAERAAELVDLIRDQSGLLVQQRPGVLSFAHLVFQEYLAADHAVSRNNLDALVEHAGDHEWREVIPLAAGLATYASETLVRALLQKKAVLLAGRCVATAVELQPTLAQEVIDALLATGVGEPLDFPGDVLAEISGPRVLKGCLGMVLAMSLSATSLSGLLAEVAARQGGDFGTEPPAEFAARAAGAARAVTGPAWPAPRDAGAAAWAGAWAVELPGDAGAAARVMERVGVGPVLQEVKETVAREKATPEQKLFLWSPLAEALQPADFGFAVGNLSKLPGEVFPLLRLCVLHRLRHRWSKALSEEQQRRLAELIAKAEGDLKAHFERFAELLEQEKAKLARSKKR